jgi:hypothetical protein
MWYLYAITHNGWYNTGIIAYGMQPSNGVWCRPWEVPA